MQMLLKVMAMGKKKATDRVVQALTGNEISVDTCSDIEEAIDTLRNQKYDVVLVDGYLADLESVCYRISWQCGTPIALIINGTQADWTSLRSLDVDGFIPAESSNMEIAAYFNAIARRSCTQHESPHVLIIEDDEQTREALRLSFQIYWPEVALTCVTQGRDGILAAKSEPVDLILLDLVLPDISGHAVLEKIRAFSHVPVIVTTASLNREDIVKAMSAGADDYVVKPFKQFDLMKRIRHQTN
jgi:DNA-binding response OmpR family regulator